VALLGYLVAEERPVARDFLAALFWPDETTSQGRSNLRRELHNLSRILPDCWKSDRQAVAFVAPVAVTVDLYALRQLEAEERWSEAAELLRGEFLEGLSLDDNLEFEHWLLGERERWQAQANTILTHVIEGHTRRGQYADALRYTRRLLQLAPWSEQAHRQAMRLLAWTGQRGAALRQFETCKAALWEELGVEPAPETAALWQQIRCGALDLPPQLPTFLTTEGARHTVDAPLFVGRERELARLGEFLASVLTGQGQVCFVTGGPGSGKTALLDAFTRQAMATHPDLLVAGGNCTAYSDVGDPYLPFRDAMAMLSGYVEAKWDAGAISREHAQRLWAALPMVAQALLDHGPHLVDVLVPGEAMLSRAILAEPAGAPWLPRLRALVRRSGSSARAMKQRDLFQQVTEVLHAVAQEQPVLLILDDIQWADVASVSLLFHLGRRLAGADNRILIACAYRPEEVAIADSLASLERQRYATTAGPIARHSLAQALSEFKRIYGDVWVELSRSDGIERRRFMDDLLDTEPHRLADGFRAALYHRTEGHPLFTIELLRAMQERGDLRLDGEGYWVEGPELNWEALPARVEAVIAERIARLDPELQTILSVASVEGEVFTGQVVAQVTEMEELQTLHRLSEDLERRHRLVIEQEEVRTIQGRAARYRFRHILFQNYVYNRLSRGERRLLHGEVAAALEDLNAGRADEMAVQLAHHFQAAGDSNRSLQYLTLAAEHAARLYANDEAIRHYSQAIELAQQVSPDAPSLAKLYRGRGLACERVGAFEQARADHKTILQMARAVGDPQLEWRALLDLGKLWSSRDYGQARVHFEQALAVTRRLDEPAAMAGSLNWMGNWYLNADDPQAAVAHHEEALQILERTGDRHGLATTLDLLGIAELLAGDIAASVAHYDRAIKLFRELGDRSGLASSLTGRGHSGGANYAMLTAVAPAMPITPQQDFEEAVCIAKEIGSSYAEAWALWSQSLSLMVRGQFGHALEATQRSLAIATRIRHREGVAAGRCVLGMLYTELLMPETARRHLEAALAQAEELRSQVFIRWAAGALAAAYCLLENLPEAEACLRPRLTAEVPPASMYGRYCWAKRAELALAQQDPALALEIVERLVASAPGMAPGRVITFLWKLKGEALAAMGQAEEAKAVLQAAIDKAHGTGEQYLLWRLHTSLGRVYSAVGQEPEAEAEVATAHQLVRELADTMPEGELEDLFLRRARNMMDAITMDDERSHT
jgi:predicted ATPase/DNA-binding SARP family transcriptional activator